MGQRISVVDAFTAEPFRGNPAGVCVLERPAPEAWMQAVATEMNLSETAFVVPRADGDHDLRWFTPTTEVPLCGHATLASTHVLGGERRFHTLSGVLICRVADGAVEMDFPATAVEPVADPPDVSGAFGLTQDRVVGVWSAEAWRLIELATAADVRAVVPDREAILELGGEVIVVATPGDEPGIDSASRVFVPGAGIDEDPVTGAAHCVIAPWLQQRTGRDEFVGRQVSTRGGTVGMRVDGDRVILRGQAVTVLEGTLWTDPPLLG
ncbi:MAG TPA: PhzF family phenazine biosynthesis protein [Acidimicrobiales bacterium]|jgi:PhzF family phenazine biosynthesis protein